MNRFNIPFSDKYKKWYQNPFIRLLMLAAILVVMIIVCVSVLNGKKDQEQTAKAGTEVSSLIASGYEESGDSALDNPASQTDTIQPDTGDQSAGSDEAAVGQTEETAQVTAPSAEGTVPAQAEDGTGAAGIMQMTEEMLYSSTETGWHYTFKGMWYSMSPGLCFYNGWQDIDGSTYHFNAEGYRDVGWKRIGGQACCFDSQGVYQPGASTEKVIAFTFDDGPSQGMDQILDLCQETGARVTFFMIGVQVENGGAVIPRIMENHCELGNHSYTHSNMDNLTPEECAADFAKCDEFICSFSGGVPSDAVRFPYGNVSDEKAQAVGKPCILWDVDSLDWESQNVDAILERCRTQIDDGNIILMHDRYDATVEACRILFPELIANGYQLVTVNELAIAKGGELQPGQIYYDF